jgi:hypothetical protein
VVFAVTTFQSLSALDQFIRLLIKKLYYNRMIFGIFKNVEHAARLLSAFLLRRTSWQIRSGWKTTGTVVLLFTDLHPQWV